MVKEIDTQNAMSNLSNDEDPAENVPKSQVECN